jgi:hypothetical protein
LPGNSESPWQCRGIFAGAPLELLGGRATIAGHCQRLAEGGRQRRGPARFVAWTASHAQLAEVARQGRADLLDGKLCIWLDELNTADDGPRK